MHTQEFDIAIVGAGIVGLSAAYYLATGPNRPRIAIIDMGAPMALTSAQSGENYRNWWPHTGMTAFTDHSISLMEDIARATGNRIAMTRRGYALCTRSTDIAETLAQLHAGYGAAGRDRIRVHETAASAAYRPPLSADWQAAPDGVDVLRDRALIGATFPSYATDVATVIHIRRAGDISGQQMGQHMLERTREAGGRLVAGKVVAIETGPRFVLDLAQPDGNRARVAAGVLVNAAGPFVADIAGLLGETLPVETVFQQKIAFEDVAHVIPRDMPFSIDLDGQTIDWTEEERDTLATDPSLDWLTHPMPGGIHCRPDGGDHGTWIKLGWAYNTAPGQAAAQPPLDPNFPDIVLRAASRLNPSLKAYQGRLPRRRTHYGGYYTMTAENWPLIGPMNTPGAFVAGALSGYGTMAACAAGALSAAWIGGTALPGYARSMSLARYQDGALMAELSAAGSKGVL